MKRKLYRLGVITLIIVEVIFVNLSIKSFVNKGKEIEQVNYNDAKEIDTSNMFAYYIDNGNGEYTEETDRTEWPDSNDYTYIKSVCHDGNGNDVLSTDVVTFDGNTFTANVSTATSMYCNVYFIKTGTPLDILQKNSGVNGSGTLEEDSALQARNQTITGDVPDDLRRFVGPYTTVNDNFICFGTTEQDTCKNNMDTYMYRIIGVDTSGRLKLIKATGINSSGTTTFQWHSNSRNTKWDESSLYSGLNNGYFMSNTKYGYMQQPQWTNLINTTATYYIGDSTANANPTLFQNERGGSFNSAKIGLMYLSDYLYAIDGAADTSNWLFIQNGLNGKTEGLGNGATAPAAKGEWTMTRYSYDGWYGTSSAWLVNSSGTVHNNNVNAGSVVRPVFYLKSDIRIAGLGTIEQPYIISSSSLS